MLNRKNRRRLHVASKGFRLRSTVFDICMTAYTTHVYTYVFHYIGQWRTCTTGMSTTPVECIQTLRSHFMSRLRSHLTLQEVFYLHPFTSQIRSLSPVLVILKQTLHDKRFTSWHAISCANEGRTRDSGCGDACRCGSSELVRRVAWRAVSWRKFCFKKIVFESVMTCQEEIVKCTCMKLGVNISWNYLRTVSKWESK